MEKKIDESRIPIVKKREWQRWTPGWGLCRLYLDELSGDMEILEHVHSDTYETINYAYNVLAAGSLVVGIVMGLEKLLG